MAVDEHGANVQVFITRDGILSDRRSFSLVNVEGAGPSEVFERFVGEYYSTALVVPPEMVVPRSVGGLEGLSAFLEGLRGTKVNVRTAERGDKRRLQELADRNAALALEHDRLRAERTREHRYGALDVAAGGARLWPARRYASRATTSPTSAPSTSSRRWWCSKAACRARATTGRSSSARPTGRTTWARSTRSSSAGSRGPSGVSDAGAVRPVVRGGARSGADRRGQGSVGRGRRGLDRGGTGRSGAGHLAGQAR